MGDHCGRQGSQGHRPHQSYIAQTRFGVNGQPNYLILGRDGQELVPKRAYNLDVEAYIDFLKSGVEAYNKTK